MKLLSCLILTAALAFAQASPEVQLKAAMHKEQVEGDLKGAIEAYRKIAAQAGQNREIAARALFQVGQCQEKLGQIEARKSYERVVKEFGGQEIAAQARARLVAMGAGAAEARAKLLWDNAIDLWGTVSADGRFMSFVDWSTGDLSLRDLVAGTSRKVTDKGGFNKAQAEAGGSVISPDGTRIAFTWERWDAEAKREGGVELRVIGLDGKGERLLKRVNGWIEPQGWSPDGKWIAATSQAPAFVETEILLVSAEDGQSQTLPINAKGEKNRLSFSPDGKWLAYSSKNILYTLRADGSAAAESQVALDAQMMAWTPDGAGLLFSRKQDGVNRLYVVPVSQGRAVDEARMIRSEPLPDANPLGMTAKGVLLVGAANRKYDVWLSEFDAGTGQLGKKLRQVPAATFGPPVLNGSMTFSPDGKHLLYGAPRQGVRIHSVATGTERTLMPQLAQLRHAEWAPDGASLLVAGVGNDGKDGLFRVDLQSGAAAFLSARVPETRILSGTDGSAMIYEDKEGAAILRDVNSNAERVLLQSKGAFDRVYEVAFSHDRKKLAVRGLKYLSVIDLATGAVRDLYVRESATSGYAIWALAWGADDRHLVAIGNPLPLVGSSLILTFPVDGGEPRRIAAPAQFRGLSLSPDGKLAGLANTRRNQVLALENFLPAPAIR